jgi:broad specificity phosphatase PhoE
MTTRIFLIRHGETDWNVDNKLMGQNDIHLNQRGIQDAKQIAEWLVDHGISALYSSDLQRARQTAELIALVTKTEPIYNSALREVDAGDWTGVVKNQFMTNNPQAWYSWRNGEKVSNNGESYRELLARANHFLKTTARSHPEERIGFVTHSGVIRVILSHALNSSFCDIERTTDVAPGSTTIIHFVSDYLLRVENIGINYYLNDVTRKNQV